MRRGVSTKKLNPLLELNLVGLVWGSSLAMTEFSTVPAYTPCNVRELKTLFSINSLVYMKKNLAFLSLALACLTAAPLASAETWRYVFTIQGQANVNTDESLAWKVVQDSNARSCRQGIFAGKYSPGNDESWCASAPKKVGDRWVWNFYLWVAR